MPRTGRQSSSTLQKNRRWLEYHKPAPWRLLPRLAACDLPMIQGGECTGNPDSPWLTRLVYFFEFVGV